MKSDNRHGAPTPTSDYYVNSVHPSVYPSHIGVGVVEILTPPNVTKDCTC